ncbi:MAG: DnaB-like helicase C-terminal domain-containing protein [Methanothrix sp.]|nr:DnaB-like helicase C-terminal domain-containing protein [Methanothrix sp.]
MSSFQNTTDLSKTIFSPSEIGEATLKLVMENVANPNNGLLTGISGLDGKGRMVPMRRGWLVTIMGYASHGKSSLANRIMRNNALGIQMLGLERTRAVVTCTWEQSIEEQGLYDAAQLTALSVEDMLTGQLKAGDIEKMKDACSQRATIPWWLIGHSSSKDERRPRLNLPQIKEALFILRDKHGVKPILVTLDYLQRIGQQCYRGEMRERFISTVDDAKDMALELGCPVMLVSTTGRQVHERDIGLPEMDDGRETSNIEDSSDIMLGTWLPKHKYADGKLIVIGGKGIRVSTFLMLIRIVKQKFGKAPVTHPFFFKPEVNQISPMDWMSDDELKEAMEAIKKKGGRK